MTRLNSESLRAALGPLAARVDVETLPECSSTNALLLERASASSHGRRPLALFAERQSAGRGRAGRAWIAPPDGSLAFSLLWPWTAPLSYLSGLSLSVGLGLLQGLEALGFARAPLGLKWPNDLLVHGEAKLAGILIELATPVRTSHAVPVTPVVIGCGLNLVAPAIPGRQTAGLADLGPLPAPETLAAALLTALADVLDRQAAHGFSVFRADWQANNVWQGKSVRLLDGDRPLVEGICQGVDTDGALLIDGGHGVERFLSGDVSLRAA